MRLTATNYRVLLHKLSRNLATVKEAISIENSANDLSLNNLMETRILKIFSIAHEVNLQNSNLFQRNSPGIDGIDKEHKIMAQVTSTFSTEKIEHTINEAIQNNLYEKYEQLIFIFLKDKKNISKTFKSKIEKLTTGKLKFNFETDIYDLRDIYARFSYKQDIERLHNAVTLLDEVLNYIPDYSLSGYDAISVCFHEEEIENVYSLIDAIIKEGINVYINSNKLYEKFKNANHPLRDFIVLSFPGQPLNHISLCITVLSNAYINQISTANLRQKDILYTHAIESDIKIEYIAFDNLLKEYKKVKDQIKSYRSSQQNPVQAVKSILADRMKQAAFGNISMEEIKQELVNTYSNFLPVVLKTEQEFLLLNLRMSDQADIELHYLILAREFNLNNLATKILSEFSLNDLKNLNILVPKNFDQKTRRRLEAVKNAFDTQKVFYVDEHLFDKRLKTLKQTSILGTTEFVSPVVRHNSDLLSVMDIVHWIFNNSESSIAIINGAGGIGKTTVCQKIHDIIIEGHERNIVIFIDATQYIETFRKKATNGDIEYDLYNIFKACHSHAQFIDKNSFYLNYSLGNIIVIFDGIDEIISTLPSFDLFEFLETLQNLMERLGKGKILINCRDTYITDVKKYYQSKSNNKVQIYELLGFSDELARMFFTKHFNDEELVKTCTKLVKEFVPEYRDPVYKYPPFILEIAIQIVTPEFDYEEINTDFESKILQSQESNDVVIYRICNREFIKKEKYGFQLDIDQQVKFLCELAIEEKGKIQQKDFTRLLENMGISDRVEEVAKGLFDHPLILKIDESYVFRFDFLNLYFKSIAIFNMLAIDQPISLTERMINILADDCNFNSVISKSVISKAVSCMIPFPHCLKFSKTIIEKILHFSGDNSPSLINRKKKAVSNILVIILTSKLTNYSNQYIINYIFGNERREINNFYFIDIPQFAGIEFDFSDFYFSNSEINNYGSFFQCRFNANTLFDESCTISNVYFSKNWKNVSADDRNFDKNIKGDNSIFRVLSIKTKGNSEVKKYFREYLGSFYTSKQFNAELLEKSICAIEDEFVTVSLLTNLLKANGVILKHENGTIYLDERLKFKILRFLTQGLPFPQLNRCISQLKNLMLGEN